MVGNITSRHRTKNFRSPCLKSLSPLLYGIAIFLQNIAGQIVPVQFQIYSLQNTCYTLMLEFHTLQSPNMPRPLNWKYYGNFGFRIDYLF